MLDFNSILVFSENPGKLADFYKQVFRKDPDWSEGGYYGFMAGKGFITFGPHDKVKGRNENPERILFNFETEDVKGEFERIRKPGARAGIRAIRGSALCERTGLADRTGEPRR